MPTGADVMFETAVAAGVNTCFANPGTTEIAMVASLDRVAGMRAVLVQFEGVASGAADGFWRATGRPAIGLFHLGPGFANALANAHNARRGHSPIINVVGDQTTWHLAADAPLTSAIENLGTWAGWHRHVVSTNDVATDMAAAIEAATSGPQGPATLVVPADVTWDQAPDEIVATNIGSLAPPKDDDVLIAATALRERGATLILGGSWLTADMAANANAIASATGCSVFTYRLPNYEAGVGVDRIREIPYFPEQASAVLGDVQTAVMVGTPEPVTFFGYPDTPITSLPSGARQLSIGGPEIDVGLVLRSLVQELGAPAQPANSADRATPPTGPLDVDSLGLAVIAAIPEGGILVQEGVTSAAGLRRHQGSAAPHRSFGPTGGAIGGGLPLAVGAAVGAPDARVIAFQADGSSLYTIQSLWTMARENLDVTVVICSNQRYAILEVELLRAGIETPGPKAASLTSLTNPPVDFVSLAKGFGVPGEQVTTADDLNTALARGAAADGPYLIEAMI